LRCWLLVKAPRTSAILAMPETLDLTDLECLTDRRRPAREGKRLWMPETWEGHREAGV
jgi:hypothetical protein